MIVRSQGLSNVFIWRASLPANFLVSLFVGPFATSCGHDAANLFRQSTNHFAVDVLLQPWSQHRIQPPDCRTLPHPSYSCTPLVICTRTHKASCIGAGQLIASNNGDDLSRKYPVIACERFTIGNTIRLSDNISWVVVHRLLLLCLQVLKYLYHILIKM